MRVASLYCYPVKGLSPQPLDFADLVGKTMRVEGARLKILKMTDRCAATGVAPGVGVRDIDVVQTLRRTFGHIDCGVYAQIARGGRVALGDIVAIAD